MPRALSAFCFFPLILIARPAPACQCATSYSACHEVAAGNLVFIGTVESIDPAFLNRWNLTDQSSLGPLNDAYSGAEQHPSAAALTHLKDAYLKIFPAMAADEKLKLQAAKTTDEVATLFYSALDRGMRVRLKVKTIFKQEDDDDSPKNSGAKDPKRKDDDDDQKKAPDSLEVWTTFGDCGYSFQVGETYLVYAYNDEFSDYLFTSSCTRTRRLSDAGEDLAYLFFYKDHPEQSARLEGFATTDRLSPLNFDYLHDPETIPSPVAGVIVELKSDHLKRYAQSERSGRFLFDGLPEGDYQVSAFASGYPLKAQLLAGPTALHIKAKSCTRQILRLPKLDAK
jgi:hypothetical protein